MPFRKFVEIGRVAYAVGGPATGKLVTIVDVIDYNRALVDGPCTGVPRQEYRFTNLRLTKFKIGIQHGQHTKYVTKAWKEGNIDQRWKESMWAKTVEKRKTRQSLTDFDRFKVARLKYARNRLMHKTYSSIMAQRKVKKAKLVLRRKVKMEKNPEKKKKLLIKKPVKKLPGKNGNVFRSLRKRGILKKIDEYKKKKEALRAKAKKEAAEKDAAKTTTKKGKKPFDKTKKLGDKKTKKPGDKPKKPDDKTKKAGEKPKKPDDKTKKPGDAKAKKPDDKTKKPDAKAKKPAEKAKKADPKAAKSPPKKDK